MKGNLSQRGKSWRLKYDAEPDGSGRRQTRYATFKVARVKKLKRRPSSISPRSLTASMSIHRSAPSPLTYANGWTARTASPRKTLERYRDLVEHQIIPHLGALPLQKLRPAHIADWHAKLLKSGGQGGRPLSARTAGHAHRVLHRGLEIAVARELIARNVASAIAPPKVEDVEVEALKANEIAPVLAALEGHWLEPIAIVALEHWPTPRRIAGPHLGLGRSRARLHDDLALA